MRETSWGRVKYRTTNWKAYNAALKARGELTIWLDRDMQWLAQPTGKRGRCQKFSDAAIQFCLTIKFLGEGEWRTKKHGARYLRGAIPIIPPRKGAKLRKGLAFAHRNEAVKACRQLGRAIWKRWSGYHRRSLVETKMNCFKRLGEKVMARTFERQVTELHIRASILNQFLCVPI